MCLSKLHKLLFFHFCDGNSHTILNTLQPFSNLHVFLIKILSLLVKEATFVNRNCVTNDAAAFAKNI